MTLTPKKEKEISITTNNMQCATKEKKKNEKEAISNGILEKSKTKAEQTLTTYLQAIPEIKDHYKLNITIEDAKTDE